MLTIAAAVAAVIFVLICGANDGGTLLSLAIRHRSSSGALVVAVLAAAIAIGPGLFGLAVARTFTDRLVDVPGATGQLIFLAGTGTATVVVLVMTWRGIPTSITLALLGAIAGAALGFGATPAWSRLGLVLALGAAAPFVGALLAHGLGRVVRWLRISRATRWTSTVQLLAFTGQSLAYAANDGQKMFAVAGITAAAAGHPIDLGSRLLPAVAIAAVFTLGAVISLRRISRGANAKLLRMRPGHIISAESPPRRRCSARPGWACRSA